MWLLEHPPVYTAGTSADVAELRDPRFEVFETGRGGRYTYHGPGQRVGYLMLDLNKRGRDVRCFVRQLEDWAQPATHFRGQIEQDADISSLRMPDDRLSLTRLDRLQTGLPKLHSGTSEKTRLLPDKSKVKSQ